MNLDNLISIINNSSPLWKGIDRSSCVHTFIGKYYINICKFSNHREEEFIQVDVDDVKTNSSNLIKNRYPIDSNEYKLLLPIYENAKSKAELKSYA